MTRIQAALLTLVWLTACSTPPQTIISVVGSNDVHGRLIVDDGDGGLATFSGYVAAIREARSADGGAVVLIDAGDMWQGTLESNLSEGAAIVSAYNALGYDGAAIGNHEFDFGPLGPAVTPSSDSDDPVGTLKQRAREAAFPLLAANIIETRTGARVDWPNVQPATLIEVNGLKVGIIGVITTSALRTTIAANVRQFEIAPLAPAIEEQARLLRDAGAVLVVVAAHAGSDCTDFNDPEDVSSCNQQGEIFRVANALPAGLVDHIVAGHVHQGIAHVVNGIAITSSYSNTRAFSRADFTINRRSGAVLNRKIYAPQPIVAGAQYEGQLVKADPEIVAIAERAEEVAKDLKESRLGIHLETPFTLHGNPESSLGNLFTDALLEKLDVDVAIHNVEGGLRKGLGAGELTYGSVYESSPFENRVVILQLSGNELRRVIATQTQRKKSRIGFSGMTVTVACDAAAMTIGMQLTDGRTIEDSDAVSVAVNDYMAFGGDGVLTEIMPPGGYPTDDSQPLVRDIFIQWLRETGGSISADDFLTSSAPKWTRPDPLDPECRF